MGGQTATKASTNTSAECTGQHSQPHASQYVPSEPYSDVLALQRSAGNRAVTQLLEAEGGNTPPTGDVHHPMAGSEFSECSQKQGLGLQAKLTVNEPGDSYEREADRIIDQVMATPACTRVSGAPPHIQRFSGQSHEQTAIASASVDQVLASPGRPLQPALRQDMEQRFGHDFSRVRVHAGAAAEQSARDVNATAYTVGHDIVFGGGVFAPGTHQGRRLIAHELTHVVQQSGAAGGLVGQVVASPALQRQGVSDRTDKEPKALLSPIELFSAWANPWRKRHSDFAMQEDALRKKIHAAAWKLAAVMQGVENAYARAQAELWRLRAELL
jgi:Domain of unknown function (DUF4157)